MRIKHNCLLKKETRVSDCLPVWKKGKKYHYKNNQGVSLSFFNKEEREVSDSVSWEVTVSALREPQIISLWDLGAEFFFYARVPFSCKTVLVKERKKKKNRKMW